MSGFLRQATASQSKALGPFLDDTDMKTPETGLTIANTDIKLVINGAASVNKNSGGGTHRVNGVYGTTFNATDTANVGEMEVSVLISGALIVFDKFEILDAAAYDALYEAPSTAEVNATNFWGGAVLDTGTAQSGAAGTVTLRSGANASNDFYKNAVVTIISGTGAKQSREITGYVGATKIATIDTNWVTNPDNTSVYQIIGRIA